MMSSLDNIILASIYRSGESRRGLRLDALMSCNRGIVGVGPRSSLIVQEAWLGGPCTRSVSIMGFGGLVGLAK